MEINWDTPPAVVVARSRSNGRYVEFAHALAEATPPAGSEGWAVLPADTPRTMKAAKAACNAIRNGRYGGFAKGEFDAVTDGETIWVRYKGPAGGEAGDDEDASGEANDDQSMLPKKIREWARHQGRTVSAHGRLPRALVDDYFEANPDEHRPPELRVV